MAKVQLPNNPNPSQESAYDLAPTRRGRPLLFQVTDPRDLPVWPFLLAVHTNPDTLSEKHTKSKNVVMTYGGFVEFIWPDDLDTLSASGSTGAFLGPNVGLTSGSDGAGSLSTNSTTRAGTEGRHATMAWERQEDILDLFRNGGMIYDGNGVPVLRGRVMVIYDRGIYTGSFTSLDVKEDDTHAFSFSIDWEFKVERLVYRFPFVQLQANSGGLSSFSAPDGGQPVATTPQTGLVSDAAASALFNSSRGNGTGSPGGT